MPLVTDAGLGVPLDTGTINDGQLFRRVGGNIVGMDAPSSPTLVLDPWAAFKPKGIYIPAGVLRDGGPSDDASYGESGLNAVTEQFLSYIFAYPEVAPFAGTINSLAHYLSGGGTPKFWCAIARNTVDGNGNPYPGTIDGKFAYTHSTGFDGALLRISSGISTAVAKGELFWILYQANGAVGCYGWRVSSAFRNIFATNTPSPFSTTNNRGFIGWVTTTAVTYDDTLTAFPASGTEMLTMGNKPYRAGPTNIINRPSVYYKYA